MRRMRVKQPQPEIARDRLCLPQQLAQQALPAIQVAPVERRVLRDEVDLPATIRNQCADFGNYIGHWPTAILTANARDAAERARMVAAFGNLHVRSMLRCETHPGRGEIGHVLRRSRPINCRRALLQNLPHNRSDAWHLVQTDNGVNLGQIAAQLLRISLRQAASHDQCPALAGFTELVQLENRINGFLLGLVDEPAGINDQYIGLFGVVSQDHPVARERAEHDFAVHEVLGATEADQPDFNGSA